MRPILSVAAQLLVAGCSQQEATAPPANEAASKATAAQAPEAVPELAGQWRVTAVDGKPFPAGTTASFASGTASISSGCIRRAWSYTQKRNSVAFTSSPGGSSNCGGQAPSGEQETAYVVLDGANIAIFGKDGKEATLSGTGGTLTLAR